LLYKNSKFHDFWRITIQKRFVKKYEKEIGFLHPDKRMRLEIIIGGMGGSSKG